MNILDIIYLHMSACAVHIAWSVWNIAWMSDNSVHLTKWIIVLEQMTVRHLVYQISDFHEWLLSNSLRSDDPKIEIQCSHATHAPKDLGPS